MNPELMWISGLVVAAFLLFFFEIFLPGGILAVIGMVLLGGASVVAGSAYGIGVAAVLLAASIVAAVLLFFLEVRLLQSGPFARFFLHQGSNQSVSNRPVADDDSIVGQQGEVVTRMAPSGKVRLAGRIYVAASESGMLEPGEPVQVVRFDAFKLIVRKL